MTADARRALLARLIDHAALFPPASLSMGDALEADRRARASPEAWILGRFLVPASRLSELLLARDAPVLGVVLDGAGGAPPDRWLPALQQDLRGVARGVASGLAVDAVEVRLPAPAVGADVLAAARERVAEALGPAVAALFEVPLGEGFEVTVGAMGEAGVAAKVRCGGATAEAVPSVDALAAFVAACAAAGVRFKATAGLHHAVRHRDPSTGGHAHGFLNLLAAAVLAGSGETDLAAVLAEEDASAFEVTPGGLAIHGRSAGAEAIARTRERLFAGYGSCSFSEPVEDLRALGLLSAFEPSGPGRR